MVPCCIKVVVEHMEGCLKKKVCFSEPVLTNVGDGRRTQEGQIIPDISAPTIRNKGNKVEVTRVPKGQDARLICTVKETSRNKPIVFWVKNNETLQPASHNLMRVKPYRYLRIKKVTEEDAGFYTCVAKNIHSRGNRKLSVRFSDFADALGTVSALIYSCVLEMNSSTTASFQFNHCKTNLFNTISKRLLHKSDQSFIKTTHPGVQSNDEAPLFVGQRLSDAQGLKFPKFFKVNIFFIHLSTPDRILISQRVQSARRDFDKQLNAPVGGLAYHVLHPEVALNHHQWDVPSFLSLLQDLRSEQYVQSKVKGKLILTNVSKKDEGKYSCIVGNAFGYAVQQAYVIVH
ncbi:hypothetical protein P5673_017982 [Acropora cervicornis]|uniref:Ig-like domain-containing protein n=1 Tax=Acropora cervicornis TaxID=6130 RepID=A0AAD9QDN5_ACRCE|nr:hypothetical protein P5673_017982 [Acropora cervicornis]